MLSWILCISLLSPTYLRKVKVGKEKPEKVQLLGERKSGTNYLISLLKDNISYDIETMQFGHKHWPEWVTVSYPKSERYKRDLRTKSQKTLFIFIIRDVFDWLRSFFQTPYHIDHSIQSQFRGSFSKFLMLKMIPREDKDFPFIRHHDLNPHTLDYYENIFDLRAQKLRNMLKIRNYVHNFCMIHYEDLRDHPRQVLEDLAHYFHFNLKPFKPCTDHIIGGFHKGKFENKPYFPIREKQKKYILSKLDMDAEIQAEYF